MCYLMSYEFLCHDKIKMLEMRLFSGDNAFPSFRTMISYFFYEYDIHTFENSPIHRQLHLLSQYDLEMIYLSISAEHK